MSRTAAFFRMSAVVSLASCLFVAASARAESDYEYAKALMDQNSPSFSTDDLVERLAARLEESPASKLEAKLIKAAHKRRQAGDATVEKRVGLLKEASELYKEVLAADKDKKFRLYDVAQKDSTAISKDIIRANIEGVKDNKEQAKKYRAEAAQLIEKEANVYKAEAEAAYPLFKAAYDKFTKEQERLNPQGDEGKMPGREFLDPVEKYFDIWIIADKRYVASKSEQIETLDESDANRKKIAEEMVAHCKKRIEDDVLASFPVITSWYSFIQGRIHATMGSEDEATKSWNEALQVEIQTLPEDQKRQIYAIRKLIIHDLVKMKLKSKKYGDVEEIYIQAKTDPVSKSIFEEDAGKELAIDYARALTIPAETASEYEKAIKELRSYVAKEKIGSIWGNSFSRAMAEILMDARSKKINPRLAAQEWYDAARGFHLMGRYIYTQQYEKLEKSTDPKEKAQAPAKFEEAYKEYSNAVDYYRRAISEARNADRTDLATRLDIEPKAWFEMGLSYSRMKHEYEAIIAYRAMRETYQPEKRAKWLPDPKKEPRAYTKTVKDALAKLDLPKDKDGMLAKSGVNILIALDVNQQAHKDSWNQGLKARILIDEKDPLDPDSVNDKDYIIADGDSKQARSLVADAKRATKPEVADELFANAEKSFLSAAEKFGKVKPDSTAYDYALVQIANSYTQAQQLIADGHISKKDPKETEAIAKDLAQKALNAYQKYEEYAAGHPASDDKSTARRKQFSNLILIAKNSLYVSSGDYEKAVKSADDLIAMEAETHPAKSSAAIAYLNKFRSYLALAASHPAPESDPYLAGAGSALKDLRNINKTDNKLYVYMLNSLSDRYNIAAFQFEKKKKADTSISKEDAEKIDAAISEYEKKVADLQSKRVDVMEEGNGDELKLEDYTRLVYLFHMIGETRKASDVAVKLLKKYDPDNKNMTMPDDDATWEPFLDSMLRAIHYDPPEKDRRCKDEHTVLVDYMYDTPAGVQLPENSDKRPKHDKFNENMEKALAKLESIRNPAGEFKDCASMKVIPKGYAKPYLSVIEDEIQFRRKIVAARDLLSDMALEVAAQLKKDNNIDLSKEYLTVAQKQIDILKELRGEGAAIELKLAEIDIALGNINDAMNRLNAILPRLEPGSTLYFMAKRRISELFAEQKKWKEAAEYPEFVAVTLGFNNKTVKERWPGIEDFLKQCFANGVPMPPALKKKFEAQEAPKTDAPTGDAPKVPATGEAKPETKAPETK